MRSFVAVFAFFCLVGAAFGITEEQEAKLKEYKDACILESGVPEVYVETLKKGLPVTFDDKLNCFSACMLKKVGIMNADGTINEQVARAKVPQDVPKAKIDQVINNCKVQTGKTSCETGGKVMDCLAKSQVITLLH